MKKKVSEIVCIGMRGGKNDRDLLGRIALLESSVKGGNLEDVITDSLLLANEILFLSEELVTFAKKTLLGK